MLANYLVVPLNDNSSVYVTSRYTSGFPEDVKIPVKNFRSEMNYVQNALGYRYSFSKLKFVKPFIGFDAGIASWQRDLISENEYSRKLENTLNTFFCEVECGAEVLPEGMLIFDNSTFHFIVSGLLQFYGNSLEITEYLRKDTYHESDFVFKPCELTIYLGVVIGLDI